jgi:hypothetical protein
MLLFDYQPIAYCLFFDPWIMNLDQDWITLIGFFPDYPTQFPALKAAFSSLASAQMADLYTDTFKIARFYAPRPD